VSFRGGKAVVAHFPILEFDSDREAIIGPEMEIGEARGPECGVLCFFHEVVEQIAKAHKAKTLLELTWESGVHRVYQIDHEGHELAFMVVGVGAPMAAAHLEIMAAMGCRKVVVCGGAGVLDRNIPRSHVVVPVSAVRDEGTSYHYQAPSREVAPDSGIVAAIEERLRTRGIPYSTGKTWTTDGPYRETKGKIRRRREEGCLTVEMEAAALFAVAKFRGIAAGQILYGGDDVSGEVWDTRGGARSSMSVRERLFWLAAEACVRA
jgi:uridine phosphorylase